MKYFKYSIFLYAKKFLVLCCTPFLSYSFNDFVIILKFVLFRIIFLPFKFISPRIYNVFFYISTKIYINKTFILNGKKFFCRNINDVLHIISAYEFQIHHWFNKFVNKNKVFIDIGAHIGRYTVLLAPNFKKVISIEPDPYNFWVLRKNILLNKFDNVVLFNVGCFSENGKGALHLNPVNFGTHSLKDDSNFVGFVSVFLKRLDDIILEANVNYCDVGLVKIDVEGVEKEVLLGANGLLSVGRPAIIVESLNVGRVFKVLSSYGYRLVDVDLVGHNFLFVKR